MKISELHSKKIESLVSKKVFTLQDIVSLLENLYTGNQIKYHINKYYPDSKGNLVKEYSKGGTKLEYILKEIYPHDKIVKEFPLGEKLRVDFVILAPYNLAFEFDGSQHGEYTSFFHQDKAGFRASQERDSRKEFLLKNRGITLIRIDTLDISLEHIEALVDETIQLNGVGDGVVLDESLLTSKEKSAAYTQRIRTQQKEKSELAKAQSKKQLRVPKIVSEKTLAYKQSLKDKQKAYRDEQYQKQKQWQKENQKKR